MLFAILSTCNQNRIHVEILTSRTKVSGVASGNPPIAYKANVVRKTFTISNEIQNILAHTGNRPFEARRKVANESAPRDVRHKMAYTIVADQGGVDGGRNSG